MEANETITLAWCDSGTVHGSFTEGIVDSILNNKHINNFIRSRGIKLATQRQEVLEFWINQDFPTDWILLLDSDIEINNDSLNKLINSADKDIHPVVSGLYFTVLYNSKGLPAPIPYYFSKGSLIDLKIPVGRDIIDIDACGLGFILIHKNVIIKLLEKFGNAHLFLEEQDPYNNSIFVGEDIMFCNYIKVAGFPIYLNTDADVRHHKVIPIDKIYYEFYYKENNNEQKDW